MLVATTPLNLSLEQVRYLTAFVWVQLDHHPHDTVARALFEDLKAATLRLGAVWTYGEPPAATERRSSSRRPAWSKEGTA